MVGQDHQAMTSFADYYHALTFSHEGYEHYFNWLKEEAAGKSLLECACGTGYFSKLCAESGFRVDALDLDANMIAYAKQNNAHPKVNYVCQDMLNLNDFDDYDVIVVFLDSLNYLEDLGQLETFFKEAYKHLKSKGCLLFDVHQEQRIEEFQEEFIEEGLVLSVPYQWTIQSIDTNKIQHQLIFYEEILNKQVFTQTIFSLQEIMKMLEALNFSVEVQTSLGDSQNNEKYYIKARKD